jgi:hypothetical protein
MIALPIPDRSSLISYDRLTWNGRNLGELVEALTRGKQKGRFFAHLDPDVRADVMARPRGWRPALGQEGASQSHLAKRGVGPGDLFLFWGLFQPVREDLRPAGPPFHAIWGWLQVDDRADVATEILPSLSSPRWAWAASHPHVGVRARERARRRPNCIYVGSDRLMLPGASRSAMPGAGVFERFRPELRLTATPARAVSLWSLPGWFEPGGRTPLTYHAKTQRWSREGGRVLLQTVGRGQEFVLDVDEYPEAVDWLRGLLEGAGAEADGGGGRCSGR